MPAIVADIRDVYNSRAWEALKRELIERLQLALTKLETCTPDDLGRYQGQVALLKELINMPLEEGIIEEDV